MDKSYIIKSKISGTCYCGNCGEEILPDRGNITKHLQNKTCGPNIDEKDDNFIVEEEGCLGYYLDVDEDALLLFVCTPRFKSEHLFGNRITGIEWVPVYIVTFPAASKCPVAVKNTYGMELEEVLAGIEIGRIFPIRRENDLDVVQKVFPCIDIFSLEMFVHIYRHKGYNTTQLIGASMEQWLLEKRIRNKDWKAFGVDLKRKANSGREQALIPVYASIYHYHKETPVLQVILRDGEDQIIFLFSRGYSRCNTKVNLRELLGRHCRLVGDSMTAILQFDAAYPEYHLAQYAERSSNILVPLLAAEYHTLMELAAKAGATGLAESINTLSFFEMSPDQYHNLQTLFGVPVSVLRTLGNRRVNYSLMRRMKSIYKYQPAYLQFDSYTDSMICFYKKAGIKLGRTRGTNIIKTLTDKQVLQIIRYLKKHPYDGDYYCDYLAACKELGEFPYGITPRIPIKEAHDHTIARVKYYSDMKVKKAFTDTVTSERYTSLATCFTQEDTDLYSNDPFVIMAPESDDDLYRESINMHNCVRLYVPEVARGRTRVYFLRMKDDPMKSLGTIEVSADGRSLYQAKAFSNRKLETEAQIFIIKWCKHKGITIETGDVTEKAV